MFHDTQYDGGVHWWFYLEASRRTEPFRSRNRWGMVAFWTIFLLTKAPDFSQLQMRMARSKSAQSLVVIVSHEPHKTIQPLRLWSKVVNHKKSSWPVTKKNHVGMVLAGIIMIKVPLSPNRCIPFNPLWIHFWPWRSCSHEVSPLSKMISRKNWTRKLSSVYFSRPGTFHKIPPDLWANGFIFKLSFQAPPPYWPTGPIQVKFSAFSTQLYTWPGRFGAISLYSAYGASGGWIMSR